MISILMATHNGADTISRCLEAMSAMTAPPGGWQLVVVDNASSDDTKRRVLEWRDRLPLLYVLESRLGKSFAINTGMKHATGDLIVMTDDDVLPGRDWLLEWQRAADALPQCDVFGGAIVPMFDSPVPAWMPGDCGSVLYAATYPRPEGEIGPVNVYGPNLGIRQSIRDKGWRLGEQFLVGKYGLMGEDSDFVRRLSEAGYKVGFVPTAEVHHIVHNDQLSWWWMLRRFFRHARAMFMLDDVRRIEDRLEFSFPRWRILRSIKLLPRMMSAASRGDKAQLFLHVRVVIYDLGAIWQAWALIFSQDREHISAEIAQNAPSSTIGYQEQHGAKS